MKSEVRSQKSEVTEDTKRGFFPATGACDHSTGRILNPLDFLKMRLPLSKIATLSLFFSLSTGFKAEAAYFQTNLASNNPADKPVIIDPFLQGSRSIAIRPAALGNGGHFWINNSTNSTVTEYVGDVNNTPIFQDALTVVTIPTTSQSPTGKSIPTGQVFNSSKDFVITLDHPNGAITAPSKFIFASADGTITAWTDRKQADGTSDWPLDATMVIDRFDSSIYYGITVSELPSNNRLYAADFGVSKKIEVFDGNFNEITNQISFANPFAEDGYSPYNIQTFNNSLYVTYAKPSTTQPSNEIIGSGLGKLARFDYDGNLISTFDDQGLLNVPAGIAIAPSDFGKFSNALIVANFGDGSLVAFDLKTNKPLGYLSNEEGKSLEIRGIWGLTFGNGKSLGETNSLYFAAGPQDGSNNGLFGKVETVPEPSTAFLLSVVSGVALFKRKSFLKKA